MKTILPVIVIAQFFCTSLWFAGNAVITDIARELQVGQDYLAHIASAVQFGFITGTLVFAVFSISDRFSPSRVFFICSLIAAAVNTLVTLNGINAGQLILFRFLTGFFLAGIYPVGMKIASDHYQQGLGKSLGFLVGALVLGTAFPHLLKSIGAALPWQYVIYATSLLAVVGGVALMLLVPDGPHRAPAAKFKISSFLQGFRNNEMKAVALGYFGHMWELYAFWVFVPVILAAHNSYHPESAINVPLSSFFIIASGSISCVMGGYLSQYFGPKKVATAALLISCLCCLVSPLILLTSSSLLLLIFLFIWSMAVIADSPLFSTLVATSAPARVKGSSLTIVTCMGFAITIVSIQLVGALRTPENAGYIYTLLAVGPILGLIALIKKSAKTERKPQPESLSTPPSPYR
ncbi:MFS transporter [Polluticoccus soli]|uniref:MFS transporter n=1 Tax=Polluticoccus soli TaxID=3034150 RepID=UPI0023E11E6F|nr:MFS transporter [Flavipsychrobacter sp. JY13-12]